MNLNEFLATRMEDAGVTEYHKIDLQGSIHYESRDEEFLFRPNVRWGVIKNVQLEYMSDVLTSTSGTDKGKGSASFGFQWMITNIEDWATLGIAPQFIFPTGKELKGVDNSIKFILSHTLVGSPKDPTGQLHLNFRWINNAKRLPNENAVGKQIVFGYNQKIQEHDSLLIDFVNEEETFAPAFKNEIEIGWIHDLGNSYILGIGSAMDIKNGYFNSSLSGQKTF